MGEAGYVDSKKVGAIGSEACGFRGLVFFAGRSEDFETMLDGADAVCGSNPPAFLGGDDVARLAAEISGSKNFRIPFDFLDFTPGAKKCDSRSSLYTTMKELFPDVCAGAAKSSLDGHAALAFDAMNLILRSIDNLLASDPAPPLTPAAVWHSLGMIHGARAFDGESGLVDFRGYVDVHAPVDKLISVQRIRSTDPTQQVGVCGLRGGTEKQSEWCPKLTAAGEL